MFTTPITMSLDTYNEVKHVWENLKAIKESVKVDYHIHNNDIGELIVDVTFKADKLWMLGHTTKILQAYTELLYPRTKLLVKR
tara:strand:+ start:953 stop:1201 length:249 start_codon:yes stop_codon:yes gene_type:complete